MKDYTNDTPVFSDTISITETSDPAHADNINAAPKQLLDNTICNHRMIEQMQLSGTDVVIPVKAWTGFAAPYTAEIKMPGATDNSTVVVLPHPDITDAQYKILAEAAITGVDHGNCTVQLKAHKAKPTADLPLRFLISNKGE